MKRLLQILGVAFALFMVVAVADEWSFFSAAWFGAPAETGQKLSEDERRAAADTVATLLSLMRHYYLSGGDPRFAERMPASAGLIEELRSDVDYLARNHRVQESELERLVVLSVEPVGEPGGAGGVDRVEVRTREQWRFRVLWAKDRSVAEPARERTVAGLYYLVRATAGWRVEGWQPITEPEEAS